MKVPIKRMNWFVRAITFNWPDGITLAPFGVYIKPKHMTNHRMMRHESIHWVQQIEMRILPFYIWYVFEWFIKLFKYGKGAYRNISFEKEAKRNEVEVGYLDRRKSHAWWKYIRGS